MNTQYPRGNSPNAPRSWDELTVAEQDRLLLASVDLSMLGDVVASVGMDIVNATSIGSIILLASDGAVGKTSDDSLSLAATHQAMLLRAAERLRGTPLGNRLCAALGRAPEHSTVDVSGEYSEGADDETLRFIRTSAGDDSILDPKCYGGYQRLQVPIAVQVRGESVPTEKAEEMLAKSKLNSAFLDGIAHASRILRRSPTPPVPSTRAGTGLTLRDKRRAHFVGALIAAVLLLGGLLAIILDGGDLDDAFPVAMVFALVGYVAGWVVTRLWSWYNNTPPS